jgi:ABC-type Fe3+/spermidine/putrescine transport system ATPase subunit
MSLRVRGLRFTYPGWEPTLRAVDLEVAPGRSAFILGPSGSGKSTILRCIAGLERPDAGTVELAGRDITGLPPHRRGVGMLAQEPALFPHLRVWRNVAFGLRYRTERPRDERAEALRWLGMVELPPDRADARVDELSGGQRSRVALARTLAARPQAVLLDEPLNGLDRDLRDELGPRVRDLLREQGVCAVWVTHDRDEAIRLGDERHELVDGRLQRLP